MRDALNDSINSPGGRLAEILVKRMVKGENGEEMPISIRNRFEKLVLASGKFGLLARVRLAADVTLLFERAPRWTAERIVPLFDWSSPDARAVWNARKYSSYIGSPELFALTKIPFLELFGRSDIAEDDLRVFGEWLAVIIIANRVDNSGYPITPMEARSALRAAGTRVLASVAHRLTIEMETAKLEEKIAKWRNVVGPVFELIWPLDTELQSSRVTYPLVQILLKAGNAFPEAAETIIPFIQPENQQEHVTIFSISRADDFLYELYSDGMLDLLATVVGDTPPQNIYGLKQAIERVQQHMPELTASRKFQRLTSLASYH